MPSTNDDIPPWVDAPDIPLADPPTAQSVRTQELPRNDGYNTLEGYIHRETAKAILFELHAVNGKPVTCPDDEGAKHWFPLSQTKSITRANSPDSPDDYDIIRVSDWIARTKGII